MARNPAAFDAGARRHVPARLKKGEWMATTSRIAVGRRWCESTQSALNALTRAVALGATLSFGVPWIGTCTDRRPDLAGRGPQR